MPSRPFVPILIAFLSSAVLSGQGDHLYSIASTDGMLRRVNPVTCTTQSATQMVTTATGVLIQGGTGLTCDPVSGQLYAILREVTALGVRKLAAVDPLTAGVTIIGLLNDNFAGLAFRSDGVLFGVTGDGATVPESLYTINPANAAKTLVMALGNGGPGESIAFGHDGFLYHLSGCCVFNVDTVLERIDTTTNFVTNIPLSGFSYFEILSSTLIAGGNLLAVDLNDDAMIITTSGVSTQIGTFDHSAVKGLAYVPSPATQAFFRLYGFGCSTTSGTIPLFVANGTPTGGMNVQFDLLLAPPSSTGVLAVGTANFSVPIPSAACPVQILPISPDLIPIATTAAGAWTATVGVPVGLVGDLFTQTAMLDGVNLVVSNPIHVHLQ